MGPTSETGTTDRKIAPLIVPVDIMLIGGEGGYLQAPPGSLKRTPGAWR